MFVEQSLPKSHEHRRGNNSDTPATGLVRFSRTQKVLAEARIQCWENHTSQGVHDLQSG